MGWIKFDTDTSDKPEVWQIANDLGIDPDAVVGKLLRVWAWFDDHTVDGNAPCVTKKLLDRAVGVTGFCDSMVSAGWMTDDGVMVGLSNFDRHNGKTAKERALTAQRVANSRAKGNGASNGTSVTSALPREEKEKSKNKDQEQKTYRAPRSLSVSVDELVNDHGVDKQVAADWLTVRKAKKSPLTQTALDNLITEFATAGLSVADGVRLCVQRGWVGFKPDWLKNEAPNDTATNHRRRLTPADVCQLENEQHAARREGRVYNA